MSTSKPGSGSPRKKRGHGHDEEHENHERWLVTYADMVTLLMVLFIVMFSMSSLDTAKFKQLASGLASSFGSHDMSFTGNLSPMSSPSQKELAVLPLEAGAAPDLKGDVRTATTVKKDAVNDVGARSRATANAAAAAREVDNLKEAQKKITAALQKRNLEDNVQFHFDERGLVVTVVTSAIVFSGDRANLLPAGEQIIDAIAPALRKLPNRIQVDGHTNQLQVPTLNYPSAWELSTARASAVVRELSAVGIAANRLAAAGYAGTRPLISPDDPRSVTMNRRVDVVVLADLSPTQAALIPSAAG